MLDNPFCPPCLKGIALGIILTSLSLAQSPEADKTSAEAQVEAQVMKVKQTMAVNNLRQLGLALFEFETEYGAYPNEKTAADVKTNTGSKLELKGVTADDCFRQLIAANILQTEECLTAGEIPGKAEDKGKPAKWVFSYASLGTAAGSPRRPLAFYPMVRGKTTFDPVTLNGKAVVLFADNSVRSFPIEKDGKVLLDGKDMFDPAQPYWGGKEPDIKWLAE